MNVSIYYCEFFFTNGDNMKDIFDEVKFGDFTLQSRIFRSGMWETQRNVDGSLKQSVYDRYEQVASSGVGAINSEIFCLDPRDRFADYSVKMNYRKFFQDYREISRLVHEYDVPILGQLAFFWYNYGSDQEIEPNNLTIDGIRHLQTDVIMTAKKMEFAGFDGIQLNIGNNFFLSRFINPYFNQRKDDYGGNTFNRMRIVLEILKVIKNNYDLHVNVKFNPTDIRKGGITYDESLEMAKLLEKYGADSFQLTARTATFNSAGPDNKQHPFITYIDKLNAQSKLPVILGGTLRNMDDLNYLLNNTSTEFFSMSKPFTAQWDFLKDWKRDGHGVSRCTNCGNCYAKKKSNCFVFSDGT